MATVYYYSQATGSNDGTSEANAFTAIQTALNSLSAGDHLYCKKHSSREGVKTTNLSMSTSSNTNNGNTIIEGYETTPGDGVMYQTYSPIDFTGEGVELRYIDVDADGDSSTACRLRGDGSIAYRCKFVNSYAFGNVGDFQDSSATECYFEGTVTSSGDKVVRAYRSHFVNCTVVIGSASGSAGAAIEVSSAYRNNIVVGNLIINQDSDGPESHVGMRITSDQAGNCLLANNTVYNMDIGIEHVEGVRNTYSTPSIFYGNIFYSVAYGIKNSQGLHSNTFGLLSIGNAFGSVTTAETSGLAMVVDSVTLTASPFEDTTNFQLNDTSGGGALIKGKLGRPDLLDIESTTRTQFQSFGAVQPTSASSSTLPTIVSFF